MTPSSQTMGSPVKPGRFRCRRPTRCLTTNLRRWPRLPRTGAAGPVHLNSTVRGVWVGLSRIAGPHYFISVHDINDKATSSLVLAVICFFHRCTRRPKVSPETCGICTSILATFVEFRWRIMLERTCIYPILGHTKESVDYYRGPEYRGISSLRI